MRLIRSILTVGGVLALASSLATATPVPSGDSSDSYVTADASDSSNAPKESKEAKEKDGEMVLTKYFDVSKRNIVGSANMVARFAARVPKLGKQAALEAKRYVLPNGKVQYDVTDRGGDVTVIKEVIARFMSAEMDGPPVATQESIALTPDNYKFKYRGLKDQQGLMVHVFEVNPRKKRVGLFKGEIWVDSDTGLTIRESGRFVKTPSVFLKKVEFARDYEIIDGRSVPKSIQTKSDTRFWGLTELDIEYSNFRWDVAALGPLANGMR